MMLRAGMSAATPFYRAAVAARNAMFNTGIRKPARLPRPAISVGNITTGGTGKTPMVCELARRLDKPAVLLRGYRAAEGHSGDEATMLQHELGEAVPVEANPDRVAGAAAVLGRRPDVQAFILDDGFQHRQVHRDLDLVLIDALNPFGFGRLLPRGLLREPPGALRRADAVIVTRADQVEAGALRELDRKIESLSGRPPIAHAAHQWACLCDHLGNEVALATIGNRQVAAVTGLGNPAGFERSLQSHCAGVALTTRFDDHHAYTAEEVEHLLQSAHAAGCDAVVTTEKDFTKWPAINPPLPVYRAVVRMVFLDGEAALVELMREWL
jgi:tetraacyldisaccharide 4'-kinase